MNFREKYKKMNEYIKPDERTTYDTLIRMKKANRTPYKKIVGIATAACAATVFIVLGVTGVFSGSTQDDLVAMQTPVITAVQTESPTAPTPPPVTITLTGMPVKYSELGLNFPSVEYPDVPQSTACLAAFSEDMIMQSALIIQGTVENIRFNHYFDTQISAVYELRIDNILYSEKDVSVGDVILIEQNLYMNTMIQDSIVGLKQGGQYILPIYEQQEEFSYVKEYMRESDLISDEARNKDVSIEKAKKLESRYSIIYPHMPPIQVVPGVGYMFPKNWASLVTDDATPVEMDVQVSNDVLYAQLYLRKDGFIDAFRKLIDMYVNEDYRKEQEDRWLADDLIIENGRVKTTSHLAVVYAAAFPDPVKDIDIKNCEQTETGNWLVQYYKEGSTKVYTKSVPEYLDVPTNAQIIAIADEYLLDNSLTPIVCYDELSQCFYAYYEDADGEIKVRAEMNIIGDLHWYTIFE